MNSTLFIKEIQLDNSRILNKTSNIIEEFRSGIELSILTLLFFFTIVGNASVIVLLMLFGKKRTGSRIGVSRMSFYIIHLSIADISVAVMSILPQVLWRNYVIFMNSHFLCKLVTFIQLFSVYASTFVLIVMAYDRYSSICSPIKSFSWNNKSALLEIGAAWLLAAIVSSPQLFLYKIQNVNVNNVTVETCYVKWGSRYREALYLIFHTSTQFIVPLIILTFFYTNIFLTVAKNKHFKAARSSFESGQNSPTKSNSPRSRHRSDSQRSQNTRNLTEKSSFKCSTNINDANANQALLYANKSNNAEDSIAIWQKRASYDSKPKNLSLRHNYSQKVFTKSKMKTLKLTLTVVIAYVLCSLPFYVSTLFNFIIGSSIKKSSDTFTLVLHNLSVLANLLFQLNSCANPFIYMVFNGIACNIIKKKRKLSKSNDAISQVTGETAIDGSIKLTKLPISSQINNNNNMKKVKSNQHHQTKGSKYYSTVYV